MLQTLTALAEPNRLRIVELLRAGPRPVGGIGKRLGLQQPQVSKHLRVLKEAGLVEVEAVAQERRYGLRPAPFRELQGWLDAYRQLWEARYLALDEVVQELNRKEGKEQERHGRSDRGKK